MSAANPRKPNTWGHIVRWHETDGDHTSTTFEWDLFLLAGQGRGSGDGSTIAAEDGFGSPDGIWSDRDGRVWIQTDGSQPLGANDQMLAANPYVTDAQGAPELRRFLTGPVGCEVTGVVTTPDQRTMFVNIQHPGEAGAPSQWPHDGRHHDPAGGDGRRSPRTTAASSGPDRRRWLGRRRSGGRPPSPGCCGGTGSSGASLSRGATMLSSSPARPTPVSTVSGRSSSARTTRSAACSGVSAAPVLVVVGRHHHRGVHQREAHVGEGDVVGVGLPAGDPRPGVQGRLGGEVGRELRRLHLHAPASGC